MNNNSQDSLSLYNRIGGKEAVQATVTKLYGKILTDNLLNRFFDPDNIEQLKRSQIAFITMAFGGPHDYTGEDLRTAHAPYIEQGLSDKHFDAVAGHLAETMRELGVDEGLIEEALAIVETTRAPVLGKDS